MSVRPNATVHDDLCRIPISLDCNAYIEPAKLACRNSRPEAANNATKAPCRMRHSNHRISQLRHMACVPLTTPTDVSHKIHSGEPVQFPLGVTLLRARTAAGARSAEHRT
jgi:hypothetical protein